MKYLLIEAFSAAVILIPAFALLHKYRFHSSGKAVLYTAFAVYLAAVYHLVGLPTVQFLTFEVTLNLIPFAGMIEDLKNSLLNVLLFVPLGFFLPLLWGKYRRMRNTMLFGLCTTVIIELLQLLTFRATDINDVITNTFGSLLGCLLFLLIQKRLPKSMTHQEKTDDLWVILAVTAAGMFFLQPVAAAFLYRIT